MVRALEPLDISADLNLVRLAEDVAASGMPRLLRRDGEDVAVLMPVSAEPVVRRRTSPRRRTKADHEAFLASAGSWQDVDTDQFIEDNYESRRSSSRPPVDL